MSHPIHHSSTSHNNDDDSDGIVLKPKPFRPFEFSSPPPSAPSTPPLPADKSHLQAPPSGSGTMDGASTPSRTRSFLNLTSSTLFGIYQPTGYSTERDEATTPWGTGAQTPAESPTSRQTSPDWSRANLSDAILKNGTSGVKVRRQSAAPQQQRVHRLPRRGFKGYYLPLAGRVIALFAIGVSYALMITHLHDRRELAPVKVDLNRGSWTYLAFWGVAGVLLGEAMPWADTLWEEVDDETEEQPKSDRDRKHRGLDGWMDVVRSIGAFVGIAFAIRKLPWQSTLQLSLTLALANPALWYLIDRSPPGFVFSSIFSLSGTVVLLGINPALVPSPSPAQVLRGLVARNHGSNEDLMLGIFSPESVGVATWIASVLFVSAICIGNIGRRLAVQKA